MQTAHNHKGPKLKDWVNIIGGVVIVGFLIYGTIAIMKPGGYVIDKGINNFFPYIPTAFGTILFLVIRIIFEGNISTNMCIFLVLCGFILLLVGAYSKEESLKNTVFGVAGGVLGLGLGVPFGESLRTAENRRQSH